MINTVSEKKNLFLSPDVLLNMIEDDVKIWK